MFADEQCARACSARTVSLRFPKYGDWLLQPARGLRKRNRGDGKGADLRGRSRRQPELVCGHVLHSSTVRVPGACFGRIEGFLTSSMAVRDLSVTGDGTGFPLTSQ